jgi:hypothetical protein
MLYLVAQKKSKGQPSQLWTLTLPLGSFVNWFFIQSNLPVEKNESALVINISTPDTSPSPDAEPGKGAKLNAWPGKFEEGYDASSQLWGFYPGPEGYNYIGSYNTFSSLNSPAALVIDIKRFGGPGTDIISFTQKPPKEPGAENQLWQFIQYIDEDGKIDEKGTVLTTPPLPYPYPAPTYVK